MYHENGVLSRRRIGYILMLIIALLNAAQADHDDLSPVSSPSSFPPHLPSTFPPASHALSLYPQDQKQHYYGMCDFECDVDCLMIHQLKRRLRVVGFVECYLDCMNKCFERPRHSDTTKAAGILRNILGSWAEKIREILRKFFPGRHF